MKTKWFEIRNSERQVEVYLYDEIGGWGVYAADFKRELDAAMVSGAPVLVDINSPGGDVFEGAAIYNAIVRYGERVSTRVSGVAASAASIVFLAGAHRTMGQGAFVMIHNPWTVVMGTSDDLRSRAATLDKITDEFVQIYSSRTDLSPEAVKEAMNAETWYGPDAAYQAGFAHAIEDYGEIAARAFDWRHYGFQHVPAPLWEARRRATAPTTERELEESLQALGYSKTQAQRLVREGYGGLRGEPAEPTGQGDPDYASSIRELTEAIKTGGQHA